MNKKNRMIQKIKLETKCFQQKIKDVRKKIKREESIIKYYKKLGLKQKNMSIFAKASVDEKIKASNVIVKHLKKDACEWRKIVINLELKEKKLKEALDVELQENERLIAERNSIFKKYLSALELWDQGRKELPLFR